MYLIKVVTRIYILMKVVLDFNMNRTVTNFQFNQLKGVNILRERWMYSDGKPPLWKMFFPWTWVTVPYTESHTATTKLCCSILQLALYHNQFSRLEFKKNHSVPKRRHML